MVLIDDTLRVVFETSFICSVGTSLPHQPGSVASRFCFWFYFSSRVFFFVFLASKSPSILSNSMHLLSSTILTSPLFSAVFLRSSSICFLGRESHFFPVFLYWLVSSYLLIKLFIYSSTMDVHTFRSASVF